jgi:F0F1-type ATP synthase assembly protein I
MATEGPSLSSLLGMGAAIACMLAVGLGLGALVDSLAHTGPVFLLIGLLLGIVGAVGYTVVLFRRYLKTSSTSSDHLDQPNIP